LVNHQYRLVSNASEPAIRFLKTTAYPEILLTANEMTMALAQDQEKPPGETAWTVLDAAIDLGDTHTVDACRRVIDANLRGEEPATSDMAVVLAFFG
jgi:hypothetical protein